MSQIPTYTLFSSGIDQKLSWTGRSLARVLRQHTPQREYQGPEQTRIDALNHTSAKTLESMRIVSYFELPATNGVLKSHGYAFSFVVKQYRSRRELDSDKVILPLSKGLMATKVTKSFGPSAASSSSTCIAYLTIITSGAW